MRFSLERATGRAMLVAVLCAVAGGAADARSPAPRTSMTAINVRALADGADSETEARNRIVEAIEKKYSAKVVRVNVEMEDGRKVYELRLLNDERMWMIRVDAETGRELPAKN